METLGFVPRKVTAGETVWIASANTDQSRTDITISNHSPADGDSLAYQFAAPTPVEVAAVANAANTGWTLTISAAQTLLWTSRTVGYTGMITDSDSRVFKVDSGLIEVAPSPLRVSQYAAALTAIETAISNFASNPEKSFTLGDFSVSYGSVDELLKLRDFYKSEVAKETANRTKRIIRTRFTI